MNAYTFSVTYSFWCWICFAIYKVMALFTKLLFCTNNTVYK